MSEDIFDAIHERELTEVERMIADDSSVVESKQEKKTPFEYVTRELKFAVKQLSRAEAKNPPDTRRIATIREEMTPLTAIQAAINIATLRYRGEATTDESSPDGSPITMQGDKLRLFQATHAALQAAEHEYLDTQIKIDREAYEELDELVRDLAGMTHK